MGLRWFASGFKSGSACFGHTVTLVINTALLTAVYFTAVAATSIAAKLAGKRFLELSPEGDTYWKSLGLGKKDKESYYRQF